MYNQKQVFAAACMGLLFFGITLITLGSILPALSVKFELDRISSGRLTSILPAGILAGSLLFGPITDRYGYKLLLIFTTLLVIVAFEGLAFADSFFLLQVCVFVTGFGGGILNGATNALVADISTGDKGANLSLLGAFFGFGALGVPLLLGVLSKKYDYDTILSTTGYFLLLVVIYFIMIRFPKPKQAQGFPVKEGVKLLKEPAILLTGFFLFFQSGAEALVNNWTTSFLQHQQVSEQNALFILTFFVAGLTAARLALGVLLKKISSYRLLLFSLTLALIAGIILLFAENYALILSAYIILGAGLAAGFPVILGYVGQLYAHLSGTAFSIVLVIALTGNILTNYFFGIISQRYGLWQFPQILSVLIICLLIFLFLVRKKISSKVKM